MEKMRTFLAIELPEKLKERIFAFSKKVAEGCDIKLVEKENLHLTLVFLGRIDEEETSRVVRGIGEVKGIGNIKLRLGELEVFPNKRRPYGVWMNVEGEKEKLFSLYKKIIDGLLAAGIKLDESKLRFSPHITIGRFRGRGVRVRSGKWEERRKNEFWVEKVTLFQSQLSSAGPQYTKIGEFEVK